MNAPAAGTDVFPRAAVWAVGVVLAATLAGVTLYRTAATAGAQAAEPPPAAVQRALHFRDLPDGGVAIVDAASGRTLDVARGEQGFLRGTVRAMVRERRARGLADGAPLVLVATADGGLQLTDPSTDARIDLAAFGPDNAGVFARWLHPGAQP